MNLSLAPKTTRRSDTDGSVRVTVTLTLSAELATHLQQAADGRGQTLDDMLSDRLVEFREQYGLV